MPKKQIQRKKINRIYSKKSNLKKKSSKSFFGMLIYILLFFVISAFILLLILYNKVLKDLPDVKNLENLDIAESSIMYDRNGKELYKIFKEKRTYKGYNDISKNMVNALVAGEDKRYWENPGVDFIGLIRAGIEFGMGKSGTPRGTSTLTQQLIRNTIIVKKQNETMREGVDRKVKEIFLSFQLTKKLSKEKILELYLNKISFGHNAYGVEEAAKTFFDKHAKDLNIFESSVLASLPKGPSAFSPYNHYDKTIGYPGIKKHGEDKIQKVITSADLNGNKILVSRLKQEILGLKGSKIKDSQKYVLCGIDKTKIVGKEYNIDTKGCSVLDYSTLDNFISDITIKDGENTISYYPGRKDYILQRMLEDGYINFNEYKQAIIEGFVYDFNESIAKINAPHFVFYIREYLEEKYGKEVVERGGLRIYTSLDLELQKKAEEIIKQRVAENTKKFNAKNSGLITIDNETGGITAMVGSVDYYNKENKGNVNVITSKLQPGSSFKPFVYSLAMLKNEIGTKTPVYDVDMSFPGGYNPNNYDGKFMGKMNISTALNYSRNIPAIKMYYLAGGSKAIINFLHELGANSLKKNSDYGASLALGTGEMTPLDLAYAYSAFANLGEQIELSPIVKVLDSKGNIIEEKTEIKKKKVMPATQAFMINSILSDTTARPSGWNKFLSLSGRKIAAKTGTSTKEIWKNGKKVQYPANLWTIGYTPQFTTVVWSGNTDGETLYYKGNGLEGSGPIMHDFMDILHRGKKVKKWSPPAGVKNISISSISGKLPNPEGDASSYLVSSYFINPPKTRDNSYQIIEYDALCYGKVTNETPKAAIRTATILEFHSLRPESPLWETPVQKWAQSTTAKELYGSSESIITNYTDKVCERGENTGTIQVKVVDIENNQQVAVGNNPIQIAYRSDSEIQELNILINDSIVKTIDTKGQKEGLVNDNFFIPGIYRNSRVKLEIRALNKNYYSSSDSKNIIILSDESLIDNDIQITDDMFLEEGEKREESQKSQKNEDTGLIGTPIHISMIKPSSGEIKIYQDTYFNLKATLSGVSNIKHIGIYIDGRLYKNAKIQENLVESINQNKSLKKGQHKAEMMITDKSGNTFGKSFTISIL